MPPSSCFSEQREERRTRGSFHASRWIFREPNTSCRKRQPKAVASLLRSREMKWWPIHSFFIYIYILTIDILPAVQKRFAIATIKAAILYYQRDKRSYNNPTCWKENCMRTLLFYMRALCMHRRKVFIWLNTISTYIMSSSTITIWTRTILLRDVNPMRCSSKWPMNIYAATWTFIEK